MSFFGDIFGDKKEKERVEIKKTKSDIQKKSVDPIPGSELKSIMKHEMTINRKFYIR